jgi:hypothetical protein
VPSPPKPHGQAKKGSKIRRKLRSNPCPTYPKAHKWEVAVPLLLLHYELQKTSKKREKEYKNATK